MVKTPADGDSNDVKIAVPFKYLSSFRRTLEMPLINSKVNIDQSCYFFSNWGDKICSNRYKAL